MNVEHLETMKRSSGPALTRTGPTQCLCRNFKVAGIEVITTEIGDLKVRYQARKAWFGGMLRSFISPEEASSDISATPNNSKSNYTLYLISGQVPPAGYGKLIGHVLNEHSNDA